MTLHDAAVFVRNEPYSRYPVKGRDFDDVLGFVHVRDMLLVDDPATTRMADLARPIEHIPGTVEVLQALNRMRSHARQIAVVVDEYGGTAGIVTLEDVIEEIVGEVSDEHDDGEPERFAGSGDQWTVSGLMRPDEIRRELRVIVPESSDYDTLGGYVMDVLRRVPAAGDAFDRDGLRVEVLEMDGRRVDQVRLTVLDDAARADDEEKEADDE